MSFTPRNCFTISRGPRADDTPAKPARGFRPDIEGLRAIAVGAVLLYHAGFPLVTGGYVGVDVFFVISGFLITGLLARELASTGRISLRRFYARRVRRLLPAAVVCLIVTGGLSWLLLSPVHRLAVSGDIAASGLYVVNWRLAARAVDYFAPTALSNPVQHYWSLAVEEQFYLVWPALLLAVAWLWWRRRGQSPQALMVIVGVVGLTSLGYCLYATYHGAADAYFSTFTRGWEFALGGAVALVLPRLPAVNVWIVRLLGVSGLAAIGFACLLFTEQTAFPGAAALVPTLGAAALIIAGAYAGGASGPGRWVGDRLLTWAPLRHVGRISYSWYLWHWPVLVFAAEIMNGLTTVHGLLVVAFSYVPAVLSYRFVEEPFRRSVSFERRPGWTLRLAFGCTAAAVGVGLLVRVGLPTVQPLPLNEVEGAEALRHDRALQVAARAVRPDPLEAKDDIPEMAEAGCQLEPEVIEVPKHCIFGSPDSDTTVVALGDSHLMNYAPALKELAEQEGWRLVVLAKAGCTPSQTTVHNAQLNRAYTECDEWRELALERIGEENPDLILTTGRATTVAVEDGHQLEGEENTKALEAGWVETLERLGETDAVVVVIRDNPQLEEDVPACVSESLRNLEECAAPQQEALDFEPVEANAARQVDGVDVVDLTPVLCPEGTCPAVIGDAIVYRDTEHLTATFAKTLPYWLEAQLPSVER